MNYIQQAWRYVLNEPFTWLFYAFFQPARFKREYESKGIINRMIAMLRLALPMFLCCYPLALLMDILRSILQAWLAFMVIQAHLIDRADTATATIALANPDVQFLPIAIAIIVSIAWSALWGVAGGIAGGIAWGIILSIAGGISVISMSGGHTVASITVGDFVAKTLYGLTVSTVFGLVGGAWQAVSRG